MTQRPERALEYGLASWARAAAALGANTLAVLVVDSGSFEIAYLRTAVCEIPPPAAAGPCAPEIRAALESAATLSAHTPAARFLTSAVAPQARSFLLSPWPHGGVTVVFGFESPEPPRGSVPPDLTHSLDLASLAAWSLKEVSRLRRELRRTNHSFAGRKLVERAKGILQSERGMNEQQAYEYLRRTSRQRRITLSQLAEDLLGAARWP